MSNEDAAASPPPAEQRHELDPRTGAFVLASVMEERRARNRARNTPTQARLRAAEKARKDQEMQEMLVIVASLPAIRLPRLDPREVLKDRLALRAWLALDFSRQRQLRKNEARIDACRIALQRERLFRGDSGIEPTPAQLAPIMAKMLKRDVDRREARKTLEQVLDLEKPGGPWGTVR